MIVITEETANNLSSLTHLHDYIYCADIRDEKELYSYFKHFYNATDSFFEIVKHYPNLMLSGLSNEESTAIFHTPLIRFDISSIKQLKEKLYTYKDDYIVLHSIQPDTITVINNSYVDNGFYNDGDNIRLELYLLNEYCDARLNSFLRNHTINSLLDTL